METNTAKTKGEGVAVSKWELINGRYVVEWTEFVDCEPGSFDGATAQSPSEREWVKRNEAARKEKVAKTVTLELTREELEHAHEALTFYKNSILAQRLVATPWPAHQKNAMIRTKIERAYSGG